MRNEITERPLRIERLESRSLLAAGMFEFLVERDNHKHLHESLDFQDRLDRPNAVAVSAGFRGHFEGHNARVERSSIRGQDAFFRSHDRLALLNDRVFSNRDIAPTREQVAVRMPVLDRINASSVSGTLAVRPVATIVVVMNERPSESLTVARTVAPQATPVATNSRPETQGPVATQGFASTLRASATLLQRTETGVGPSIPVETAGMDPAQSQDNVPLQSPASAPAPLAKLHFGTDNAGSQDGYIELLPLWKTDPLNSEPEASEWKIDSNAIPHIRNALQSPLYRTPELADLAIRDWFAGPGGLINLDHGGSPALYLPVPSELINVELESMVGLHRSLDLIAAGVTEPISGPMLEAILASIEDITASESQPISEATPFQLPTVAYPALAVIASGVTIAAHRRRSHLNHPEEK